MQAFAASDMTRVGDDESEDPMHLSASSIPVAAAFMLVPVSPSGIGNTALACKRERERKSACCVLESKDGKYADVKTQNTEREKVRTVDGV